MELETFVFSLSVVLELIGAACIATAAFSRGRWYAVHAEIGLIGCICGLGSVTILGAVLRMACGLVSGGAVVLMALAVIHLADREMAENPYAAGQG